MSEKPIVKDPNRFKPVVGNNMARILKNQGVDEDDFIIESDPMTDIPIPLSDKSIEVDKNLSLNYERIWLEPRCNVDERTWCNRPQDCTEPECGEKAVEYIRADLTADKSQGRDWMAIEAELAVAKARIVELENEISYLGEIGDTCTYPMLQKVCNGCKCHRAAFGRE